MTAGLWPRLDAQRLLVIDDGFEDRAFDELPELLGPGDLLVVNDAATLPASLHAGDVELRLVGFDGDHWRAVLLGEGSWRDDTDARPAPADVDRVRVGDLGIEIVARDPELPRLVTLRFDRGGTALWEALYAHGTPVQYSYLTHELPLAAVQTPYAARPWAAEMPSAGRALTWRLLDALRNRGVAIAALTHTAGLSATGDAALDARLPLPEAYELPQTTVDAVGRARRVIAVGTSVVRALEGNFAEHGRLSAGRGRTDLVIDQGFAPRVVDGLLSGMHEPHESHFRLHRAFAPTDLLLRSYEHAVKAGYRNHEFGDSVLIL